MPQATKEEQEALISYLLPFLNLEKHFPLLPGASEMAHQAAFMGINEEQLFSARIALADKIRMSVEDLQKKKEIRKALDSLPFKDGDKVVAIGDSNTDDLGSWFYIFKHLVEENRKDLKLQWVNHALSYQNSTDVLRQASRTILAEEADWYFCAVGLFDCARLDVSPDRPMVALAESWENLAAIEDVIDKVTDNPPIWILPHPVSEQMQEDFDYFDLEIKNEDISAFREVMSGRKGFLIESMHSVEESEQGEWYYKPDGIHLSDAGHSTLVREILLGMEYHTKDYKTN